MRRIVAPLVLLCAAPVFAGQLSLSWVLPTRNDDGSALVDLAGTNLYVSDDAGGPFRLLATVAGAATTYNGSLSGGHYYFVATAYNQAGIEGSLSNEIAKDVPTSSGGLTVVSSNLVAYGISQTKDRLVMYPVGTVPLGTVCDGSMTANGLYRVDQDTVEWAGTAKPVVVFAECSGG